MSPISPAFPTVPFSGEILPGARPEFADIIPRIPRKNWRAFRPRHTIACRPETSGKRHGMSTEETRRIIHGWMDEQLVIGVRKATEKYCAENVISHSPIESAGREATIAYIEDEFSRGLKFQIHHIIVDGDFAAVHMHFKFTDGTPDQAIVDLWRVENGRLVEIWDHQQVIPPNTVSGNAMF